jgi:branched-subunit amino acid transport protein
VSTGVALVAGCALAGAAIKLVGPVLLGGREMPRSLTGIVMLLAPALLAALVVTQSLAHDRHLSVGANTAGVAAGGIVAWLTESEVGAVVVAAAVAALLRAI